MGGARFEIRSAGRPLGLAEVAADGLSVSVVLGPGAQQPAALSVVAAGRRLDSGPTSRTAPDRGSVSEGRFPRRGPDLADDPGAPGPYSVVTGTYVRPDVDVPGLETPVEVRGVVVGPVDAPGARPLVLILHGRHGTCYVPDQPDEGLEWPCPSGWRSTPSLRGYRDIQRVLASQGYVTVSIGANGVNAQDGMLADGGAAARSVLVRHHLRLWTRWSASTGSHAAAPAAVGSVARVDVGRVLLVGHSRGGEGVNRAALDSTTGGTPDWTVRGLVHIAPTAFGQNPAPGVPVVVLLPYCDGDVSDLQGQAYVDAARERGTDPTFRSAVLVGGANHNFFNTEWTPGEAVAPAFDDWGDRRDPTCGARSNARLSAAEQRSVGVAYVSAAARLFLDGDDSVLPMLDGRNARAASIGRAEIATHALGGRRQVLVRPGTDTAVEATGAVTARTCRTAEQANRAKTCSRSLGPWSTPHFQPLYYVSGEPSRRAVAVAWDRARGSAAFALPGPVDLSAAEAVDLRVAVPPGSPAVRFAVRLTDSAGGSAALSDVTVRGLPRTVDGFDGTLWAEDVRLRIEPGIVAATGLDLTVVTRVELLPKSDSGRLWLLDGWGWRDGLADGPPVRLPRVDVGTVRVDEGATTQTIVLPIRVSGPGRTEGQLWVLVVDPTRFDAPVPTLVDVPAGTRRLEVPVVVEGDDRDDSPQLFYTVSVKPVRGLVAGDYTGGITIVDDDPPPTLTVTPASSDVTEGGRLEWDVELDRPSDIGVFVDWHFVAPDPPGSELRTSDVTEAFLRRHWFRPKRAGPLSTSGITVSTYIEVGETAVRITVPTRADDRVEGREHVALLPETYEEVVIIDPGLHLRGTVTDPA